MATAADLRLVTVEEFLSLNFRPELKAELDNGVIRMMAGGSRGHARIQGRILGWLTSALRGSPCEPFGSDAAVHTASYSIRYPDVSVDCAPEQSLETEFEETFLTDPRVIVEVLSPGTRTHDEGPKLDEYRRMPSVRTIVYVDPIARTVRVLEQVGVGRWHDTGDVVGADARLACLDLTIPHAEIFARD